MELRAMGTLLQFMWRIFCLHWLLCGQVSGNQGEFCSSEIFQASCPEGETVIMKAAKYGRMKIGRCIKQSYGHIGCKVEVMDVLDSFCSGRQSCSVVANHHALVTKKELSCPADFVAYLEASFDCLKVNYPSVSNCQSNSYQSLTSPEGYISPSDPSSSSSSTPCPFHITLAPGKLVNISLFSFLPPPSTGQPLTTSSACYEVGFIKEGTEKKTIHKCLNDPRHKGVYISKGGRVEVHLAEPSTLGVAGAFLLHYTSLGCTNPQIPEGAVLHRSGNKATVECKNPNRKWTLECQLEVWQGDDVGTCDSAAESGWSFIGLFDDEHPFGTAIVVGIGATLGVLAGGILLYVIIAIFRKCENRDQPTYDYTDTTFAHIPTDYHAEKTGLIFPDENMFEQNSNTWGSQRHGNSNTLSRGGGTDHSRVPLPPLPNDNNTLSYEKPLYNRNGNV